MDNMRERIARALHRLHFEGQRIDVPEDYPAANIHKLWFDQADAVLDAMMEPDEGMLDAARQAPIPLVHLDSIKARQDLDFTARWQAALFAARTPPEEK